MTISARYPALRHPKIRHWRERQWFSSGDDENDDEDESLTTRGRRLRPVSIPRRIVAQDKAPSPIGKVNQTSPKQEQKETTVG